ncbi:MFS transporter [Litchfieldia alkalitelluris]|uniref:MFS transporter n=1 Tax=Litchfieldia alkalitelluris TaxID=304268 RepID=UPI000996342B|nr:MFS transporter [Litchfieldia alkalitelluris]
MARLNFVGILLIITGIFVASNIYTLIPIYSEVAQGLSSSKEQIVWGSSTFTISYAVGLLFFGPLSEQIGRKQVIVFGLLFSCITTICVGFSFNSGSLIVLRGIQGFSLGSFAPVAFAYTFELFENEKKRTLILSLINCGFLVAGILGQLISSLTTIIYGWEAVFYFFSVVYLLLFVCSYKIFPIKTAITNPKKNILKDFTSLFFNKNLLHCYAISFTLLLSFIAFYDSLGRTLGSSIGIDDQTLIIIRSIGLIGTVLAIFTGKITEKIGLKRTLVIGILLGLSSILLFLLFSKHILVLTLVSIPFVASISLLIPVVISLIGKLAKKNRGSATSLYSFTLLVGASFGPIIASTFTFITVMTILLVFFLCNLYLAFKLE